MKVLGILLIVLVVLAVLYFLMIMPRMLHKPDTAPFKEWLYAHRGLHDNATEAPENSMAAFRKAADAGFQLFEMKWLGEVIVGSQIQPFYLILDLYSCGEYENRSIGIEGTELTQDFQTVNSRQVQIQKDQVVILCHT